MYTYERCIEDWQDAVKPGTAQERVELTEKWNGYYSYLAKQQQGKTYAASKEAAGIIDFMLREGILLTSDSVLDIGAGMGGYTLELARHCGSVTAMDANENCLAVLDKRAQQMNIDNIKIVPLMWENLDAEARRGKYDFVFSSMCPTICTPHDLEKMEELTRRTVCIITVMRGSYEKHRREMMRLLDVKAKGMATEAMYYYNALYLMGRQPNVKCWSYQAKYPMPIDDAMERYPVYFKTFGISEERTIEFLREYYAENAENGNLTEECQMNMAMIYWNTPGKNN